MNTPPPKERASVSCVGFLVFSSLLAFPLFLETKKNANEKTELLKLIEQLGDEEFLKREAASQALEAIGEPAWDTLAEAAKSSKDPEIRQRAENLIRRIGTRCYGGLRFCLPGHTGGVFGVAISADGRFALSGATDDALILWDADAGRELKRFCGHTSIVTSVAFSHDTGVGHLPHWALSGSLDKTIR